MEQVHGKSLRVMGTNSTERECELRLLILTGLDNDPRTSLTRRQGDPRPGYPGREFLEKARGDQLHKLTMLDGSSSGNDGASCMVVATKVRHEILA